MSALAAGEAQNDAAEITLRAERRLGELVAELPKATGGDAQRARLQRATESPPTLADRGIAKHESARWQELAAVPAEEFDAQVDKLRQQGRVTRNGVLAPAKRRARVERRV